MGKFLEVLAFLSLQIQRQPFCLRVIIRSLPLANTQLVLSRCSMEALTLMSPSHGAWTGFTRLPGPILTSSSSLMASSDSLGWRS